MCSSVPSLWTHKRQAHGDMGTCHHRIVRAATAKQERAHRKYHAAAAQYARSCGQRHQAGTPHSPAAAHGQHAGPQSVPPATENEAGRPLEAFLRGAPPTIAKPHSPRRLAPKPTVQQDRRDVASAALDACLRTNPAVPLIHRTLRLHRCTAWPTKHAEACRNVRHPSAGDTAGMQGFGPALPK